MATTAPEQIRRLLDHADGTDPSACAVRSVLLTELERLRVAAGLRKHPPAAHVALLDDLAAVFKTRNTTLQGLALLHARHVSTVQPTMAQLAGHVGCSDRQLRRHLAQGVIELAKLLDERAADGGARPGNLPRPAGCFFGRDADLAAVDRLLQANPAVALRGPAGIGKTRLAVEAGYQLRDRFADGVWLVRLEHLDTPELLGLAVATVVRSPGASAAGDDPVALLADRHALLILDRCEHLGPAVATLLAGLAADAPAMRVLLTTRRTADALGAASWPMAGLDIPSEGEVDPAALSAVSGVALFADRLLALQPSFTIDEANAADVARLVRILGGMPLAIELAASCAAQMPLEAVASHLGPSIARRATFSAPAIDTPASVRGAVELGLSGLALAEHALLARLAVFAGEFDLDAVRVVCIDDADAASPVPSPALDRAMVPQGLAALVRGSLVISSHVGSSVRFRLLEVMRAYAEDMLMRGGEADRVRRRHAEYYAALAIASHDALGGEDADAWMTRLAVEHDNLRSARRWLLVHEPGLALRMTWRLAYFWQIAGQLTTGRHALADALEVYEASGSDLGSEDRQAALSAAGTMARKQSDFPAAHRQLAAALALAREREDPAALATALRRLGNVVEEQGDRDGAAGLYEESAAVSEANGDPHGVAAALNNLGIMADHVGNHEEAVGHLEQSLARLEALGNLWAASVVRSNLALALSQLERWDEALAHYQAALETSRQLGDRVGIASILITMAFIERSCGRPGRAWEHLRGALRLVDDTGDRQKAGEWLDQAARLLVRADQHALAANAVGAADALRARWGIEVIPKDRPSRLALEAALCEELGADRAAAIRAAAGSRRWQEVAAEVAAAGAAEARGS